MSKLICIKLTTGEDLIARVTPEESVMITETIASNHFEGNGPWSIPSGEVTLEGVFVLSIQQVAKDQVGMALIPWLLGDHAAKVKIDLIRHAVSVYPPQAQVEDGYIAQTSKIAVVKSMPGLKM